MVRSVSALVLLLALPAAAVEPDSEEGIVEEAWALERDPVLRPTHVDPALPGTFADGIAPWGDELTASEARLKTPESTRQWGESLDKGGPVPAAWRAEVERSRALLDGVLAATHRKGARMPPGARLESVFSTGHPEPLDLLHLGRLGLSDASLASGRGEHALALQRCADVLALSRDMSWGYLVTAMVGASAVPRTTSVCFRLARQAPPAEQRRFLAAVARIREGWGPPSAVFRQERMFAQILFASSFDERQQAALPRSMAPLVDQGPTTLGGTGIRRWLFGGMARRSFFANMTELMALSDRTPGEADPQVRALEGRVPASVKLAGLDSSDPPSPWLAFLRRLRAARARVVLLEAALAVDLSRAEHGALPKTWTDALSSGAPVDPRTGRALALDLRADAPAVRAEGDASLGAEPLSFSLAPP